MGQQEVIDVLKKAKTPLTSKEIARRCKIGESSVNHLCKKLSMQREIKRIGKGTTRDCYKYLIA